VLINLYLYNLVPDRTMSGSIPEGNVFVMSTSEELRFRGMDCKSPKLISVTLHKQKCFLTRRTVPSKLNMFNQD